MTIECQQRAYTHQIPASPATAAAACLGTRPHHNNRARDLPNLHLQSHPRPRSNARPSSFPPSRSQTPPGQPLLLPMVAAAPLLKCSEFARNCFGDPYGEDNLTKLLIQEVFGIQYSEKCSGLIFGVSKTIYKY